MLSSMQPQQSQQASCLSSPCASEEPWLSRKPTKMQIANRMSYICRVEGLDVNDTTLQTLAEGANADIRLVLGQLLMFRMRSKHLSYDQVKVRAACLRS